MAGILGCMSEHDEAGSVQVAVDTGEAEARLAAVAEAAAELGGKTAVDVHVITLRGADGWQLDHPATCLAPGDCAFTEAAGRISQAMCHTLGRWTCDVAGGALVLVQRLGD